jgi:Flp pilus assembly protein TadB
MSRERARRRAERQAEAAREAAARAARRDVQARRRARLRRLTALVPNRVRHRRQGGVLARRRQVQNRFVLLVFLGVQIVGLFLLTTWAARLALLALSAFLVPVFVTLVFDRRR